MFRSALFVIILPFAFVAVQAQDASPNPSDQLIAWLEGRVLNDQELTAAMSLPFANAGLSKEQADDAVQKLWKARAEFLRTDRKAEMDAREIVLGEMKMPFWYKIFGDAPEGGRSLYISMHGGGGAPAAVNDQQYENQKRLYQPEEGIYLVPRAATDTWNLWHQAHIDEFFDRIITNMIVFENVNPDRIYIMGYSAGGDGVYQLAPRMADRLAAAAMMAGHPNETQPDGLRNIGFTLHMGANDSAYNRNRIAGEWKEKLAELHKNDPDGYAHSVTVHEGRGHWMNLQDAVAVPWMAKFTRNPWPTKIVWLQDDVRHDRFYWLQVDLETAKAGDRIQASIADGKIHIEKSSSEKVTLLLNDQMTDLDSLVTTVSPSGLSQEHVVTRTLATICQSLLDRNDPASAYSALIELTVSSE